MKIYLAASSAEIERARTWHARLTIAGINVVSTWISVIDKVGATNPTDATVEQRREWSALDLDEVRSADVLWFLVPPRAVPTRGAWIEVGTAYNANKLLVFSGETSQSIFCALGMECATDDEAFARIVEVQSFDERARNFKIGGSS
jgi:hypothetical protein